jgi:hypothetical protein
MEVEKKQRQSDDEKIKWPDAQYASHIKILEIDFLMLLFLKQ